MDDEKDKPPLEFANQVIQQFADHLLGESNLSAENFSVIRVTFRKLGGSWFEFVRGDAGHLDLLTQAVLAWHKVNQAE